MPRNKVTVIDLQPDRKLLDHSFDGYKLNLLSLPHWSLELQSLVDKVYPGDAQYGFLHAKLFALHNHLVADIWNHHYAFYYIDKDQQVMQVSFDNENHTFAFKTVFDIPAHVERISGHFNLCLMFPSSMLAVVSDGTGFLHIISTDLRTITDQQPWKTVHSELILDKENYFVILDCRTQNKEDTEILHCLLQSVRSLEGHFCSVLTWVTFQVIEDNWKRTSTRQLEGKGIIHYAAIETTFEALYVICDNKVEFVTDTETSIVEEVEEEVKTKKYLYNWMQNKEDITITLQLPRNFDRKLFKVELTQVSFKVSYDDKVYINEALLNRVDIELTTWTIQDSGHVEIMISKEEEGTWPFLLMNEDPNGNEVFDKELVARAHANLAHLCTETPSNDNEPLPHISLEQMELCDEQSDKDTTLVRLDITSHQVTHRSNLSVQQYLFNINIDPLQVPAIVIRQDIDACVWQPYALLPKDEEWNLQHQGTLKAFGYIQSSKTNKKFACSPPNFRYSVVCEASRHIFVYNALDNGNQLHKRTPGRAKTTVKVGQQYVINIDEYGEVLGVQATNSYLFLLTDKCIVSIDTSIP